MSTTSTDDPKPFDEALVASWLQAALGYGKALEQLALAEQKNKVKESHYHALVDAAVEFTEIDKKFADAGYRADQVLDPDKHAALLDLLATATGIAEALPPVTATRERGLFRNIWCGLAAATRRRGRKR